MPRVNLDSEFSRKGVLMKRDGSNTYPRRLQWGAMYRCGHITELGGFWSPNRRGKATSPPASFPHAKYPRTPPHTEGARAGFNAAVPSRANPWRTSSANVCCQWTELLASAPQAHKQTLRVVVAGTEEEDLGILEGDSNGTQEAVGEDSPVYPPLTGLQRSLKKQRLLRSGATKGMDLGREDDSGDVNASRSILGGGEARNNADGVSVPTFILPEGHPVGTGAYCGGTWDRLLARQF
ncbi:hypothetical protein DFP72DRAFT_853083 [Ephemerocybe angulata]|uniref:Uncharacterized protein n=1 Tax=Ephemerocybe angulata TaxID=980116 RepID=A0A8H6LYP2_9AGAR|nr:hypothetical protein DFP72DRAFT_853083 [Tulosesus angulatus]